MLGTISLGFEYEIQKNGTAVILSVGLCSDDDIVVPEFIDGKTVVAIADNAFSHNSHLRSIVLPQTVIKIGCSAFAWCKSLEYVSALGIIEICDRAFIGCDSLSDIAISSRIRQIGKKAFAHCSHLTSAHIPNSVHKLGESVFEGCSSLTYATLPDNLKIIENGTFYACTELRTVKLPKALEYIDEFAFAYCISVEGLIIPRQAVVNRDAFFESKLKNVS